ncbi:TetR/AcrR family transcriptional regulator [Saccharomonospora saliphila]|uniref:TetR/AcrR family transcriptional regulator n=1 Tax=Saccharomonospora saliphila TaxID=369829 RepID=UPI00035DD2BF|nr:TetR/AcrR family transcriptional regulator [Saccharomonospora saliphila]
MTADTGDPEADTRTVRLLWRAERGARRGPKPTRDLDTIVWTAVEIADAHGLDRLSMRAVADRLGIGTMSLYTHVPGKSDLVSLMLDAVLADVAVPGGPSVSWRERVEWWARRDWALYHRHEWVLQAPADAPPGPNAVRRFDAALSALSGAGLPAGELVATVEAVDAFVRGAARRSVARVQAVRRLGVSEREWWSAHEPLIEGTLAVGELSMVRRVVRAGAFEAGVDSFELGLRHLLDGLAARVACGVGVAGPDVGGG